jgi:gliding motility-associated-like protein
MRNLLKMKRLFFSSIFILTLCVGKAEGQGCVNVGSAISICQGGTTPGLGGSSTGDATSFLWDDGGVGGTFSPDATTLNATWTPPSSFSGTANLTLTGSGGTCLPASATVLVSVNPTLAVSVTIAASPSGVICSGTSVTFTATPANGGGSPTYQWYKNSSPVGTGASYTYVPINGDAVYVVMTSNATCVTGSPATSGTINMVVNISVTASVSIGASSNPVCAGTSVTFTATPTNGGAAPTYQWYKNSSPVATGASYTYVPINGDAVYVVMTSNATCVTGNPATSGTINMVVNTSVTASVSIAPSSNPVCAGTSVTFTATPTNGGAAPTYQWNKNGSPIATGPAYTYIPLSGDAIYVVMTSNATCATGSPATSNIVTMTVTSNLPASVSIAASSNPACAGSLVTFTASPVNGGTPSYQWKVNGSDVGTGSSTYSSSTLTTGEIVTVAMTSSLLCVTGSPAISNPITMTIDANLPVSVSIAASANPVCAGTSVTFTATPTNGGTTPAYQWKLNGGNVGTNSTTYSVIPANGDQITCVLTSNATCASGSPATSNTVTMSITGTVAAGVTIAASANPVCAGTSVTFTATPVGGGTTPTYQWYKNSLAVVTGPAYAYVPLTGDAIYVVMTSNASCATGSPATSNTITMTVDPLLPASVSIAASPSGTICAGTSVTFTATPTNGGTPVYQWKVNGANVGTNSPNYTTITLANNDVVTVAMTSSALCATGNPATSNSITMSVSPSVPVSVSIVAVPTGAICAGTSVSFTATPVNGGTTPSYQWKINGSNAGTNSPTLTSTTLANNDAVSVVMISNVTCATGNPATSNVITMSVIPTPIPTLTSSAPGDVSCAGTNVTFTAGGGTTYSFRIGGVIKQTGASNIYTTNTLTNGNIVDVVVTNAGGCTATSAGIFNFVNPSPFIFITSPATCSTDLATYSLAVTVSSGTVTCTSGIATNTGANVWTITGVLAGVNVTVTVTDSGGCQSSLAITAPNCSCPVVFPPVSGGDKSYCASGVVPTITATVLTGETIDWYNVSSGGTPVMSGSLSYTPTVAGTYYALARNTTTNCVSSTRTLITVTMNPLPIATLTSSDVDNIFCAGTSILFTAAGGTNYNFRVAGVSVQNGALTTYTTTLLTNGQIVDVIVTNALGCIATSAGITNTVNALPVPTLTSSVATNMFCLGTSVTFTAGGGTNYNFRVGGLSVQNGASAIYTTSSLTNGQVVDVVVTNANGCIATSAAITNSVFTIPTINAGTGGNNCGLSFHLNGTLSSGTGTWTKVSGPGNAAFSPDANTANAVVTVTAYGTYTFRWTVVNGTCSASATVTIIFIQQPPANGGAGGYSCNKSFVMSAVVTAGTGTWTKVTGPGNAIFTPDNQQPNATVTVDQFGTYTFGWTVVNSICTSSDVITVAFHDLPAINAGRDTTTCKGSSVQLNAIGAGTVSWIPVALLSNPDIVNPIATPDTTTTFTVNLTDQFGCKNSASVIIEVRDKIVADAGPDQTLGFVFTATLAAKLAHGYETGVWRLISGTGEIVDSTAANTTVNGLAVGDNKLLWTVSNGFCPPSHDTLIISVINFEIPTLITPNMDGRNDYFVLRGLSTLGKTELIIFDRRGVQVYRNTNYDNTWDGVDYNKKPLPDDTYFYIIRTANGKSFRGYVVIRR